VKKGKKMGTMQFSITSTAGSRSKSFTFPDAASSRIITAAQKLYPAPSAGESLDAWFADIMAGMINQVRGNEQRIATANALAASTDIPLT
jgi:hypothetical protein